METLDSSNMKGTPLTQEQLAYFSESTKRAVDHALRRYRRAAVTAFMILLIGVGYNLNYTNDRAADGRRALTLSGQVVSVSGCNRDFNSITALRGVLIDARTQTEAAAEKGLIPREQVQDSQDFYNRQLTKLTLPDCRKARTLLTDDPSKLPTVPTPLFPKPPKKGNG